MKLDTLKTIESALSAAIATQMSAADEPMHALWQWKLDLESAWEEFTEKDWR